MNEKRRIRNLIQNLHSGDDEKISASISELAKIGEGAVNCLVSELKDENGNIRNRAAKALGLIGEPAVPALIEALNSEAESEEEYYMLGAAAEALGNTLSPTAVPALICAMESEEFPHKEYVAEAFGKIGDSRATPVLLGSLDGSVKWPREEDECIIIGYCADALGKIGDPGVAPAIINAQIMRGDSESIEKVVSALQLLNHPDTLPLLFLKLSSDDADARCGAAELLGASNKSRVLEHLIGALGDNVDYVRGQAANSLCELGDSRAVSPLLAAFKLETDRNKENIAHALSCIGDSGALTPLLLAFSGQVPGVREKLRYAFSKILPENVRQLQLLRREIVRANSGCAKSKEWATEIAQLKHTYAEWSAHLEEKCKMKYLGIEPPRRFRTPKKPGRAHEAASKTKMIVGGKRA